MVCHLHDGQITLGYAGKQVGPACNAQVSRTDGDQRLVMGKNMHQGFRHQFACGAEQDGYDPAKAEHDVKNIL